MKLIYTYIHTIDGQNLNLEFNFSDSYEVNYDQQQKQVKMIRTDSIVPENFFGRNIDRINLIVGKNGSRKTSLLNLLGLTKTDLNKYFDLSSDSWFSIYEHTENQYILEGNDFDLLNDMSGIQNLRKDFYVIGKYDFVQQRFTNCEFAIHDEQFNRSKKLRILYMPTDMTKKKLSYYMDDYRPGFTRTYISRSRIIEKINFLNSDYRNLSEYLPEANRNLDLQFKTAKMGEKLIINSEGSKLNLYGSDKFIYKLINNRSIAAFFKKEKTIIELLSNKQKYILYFFEQQIISAWNSNDSHKGFSDYPEEARSVLWDNNLVEEINRIDTSGLLFVIEDESIINVDETFERLVAYQLEVLIKLSQHLENIIFQNDPKCAYTKSKIEFYEKIKDLDDSYFDNYNTITVNLTGIEISQQLSDMCNLLDEYSFAGDYAYNSLSQEILTIVPGLSDGQHQLIDLMASIRSSIYSEKDFIESDDHILILLDEPGVYLHPEWLRRMIFEIIHYLETVHSNINFSMIISTHSPFLLSDVPDALVLKISNESGMIKVEKGSGGYGNNIYDLLHDSFFLESPIGEFAEHKINSIFDKIQTRDYSNSEEIIKEINFIGDASIRNILLDKVYQTEDTSKFLRDYNQLIEENKKLKKQLQETKGHDD